MEELRGSLKPDLSNEELADLIIDEIEKERKLSEDEKEVLRDIVEEERVEIEKCAITGFLDLFIKSLQLNRRR